eukprot:TRINITY_DN69_c4_g1_i1.p1 TRINITY_DN69_c4_g1~~TRINITY_DN69_c4_g1_i1.p1  ORF type:complete len:432 (-),score=113.73 TRINITY_DN69_c4_g1_i1:23-1318(-)
MEDKRDTINTIIESNQPINTNNTNNNTNNTNYNTNNKRKKKDKKGDRPKVKKVKHIRVEKDPGAITQKDLEETNYYFKDEYRLVKPYHFTYMTFIKQRMVGKKFVDVLLEEFKRFKKDYFLEAMKDGRIMLNNEIVSADTELVQGQMIYHITHRHEPPVLNKQIKIVHQDESLLVIDKPPSMPIHPCGRYRHNCVMFVLAHEKGFKKLFPCHRLDRLTSGVCLLPTTREMAQKFTKMIMSHSVQKHYLALVDGKMEVGKEYMIDQPLFNFRGSGICNVDPINGKEAKTKVVVMKSNGKYSLVSCYPLTGRTHQIRVHLKWLGFPIANDPCYGKDVPLGNVAMDSEGNTMDYYEELLQKKLDDVKTNEEKYPENKDNSYEKDPHCEYCYVDIPDPKYESLLLYLHAYSYSSNDPNFPFKYTTDMPEWVNLAD